MSKKTVWLIILGIVCSIAAWDTYLYSDGIADNSITQTVIAATKQSRLFTAFLGAIFGGLFFHFFDSDSQGKG